MELIVSEKHNAARRIADILSGGSASTKTVKGNRVYSWGDKRCMGLAGHVVEIDFPDEYNNWNEVDPAELINADIQKRHSKPGLVATLQALAKQADRVIIATDYDREGELIGKEAYELVREVNDSVPVDRVRFSSLTTAEVQSAFRDPETIDFDLAAAGEARQIIDLVWGASLTRFLTLAAELHGDDFISVGRVQTPTLKLIVDREREIEDFDPEDYWEIYADLTPDPDTPTFEAQYFYLDDDENEADRLWNEPKVLSIASDIQSAGSATVTDVDENTRNDNPPIPFNTTEFISAANAIGYNAKPAMSIAENLYDEGYITYPRTDNTVYPDDMETEAIFSALADTTQFRDEAEEFLEADSLSPTAGDTETTDHPPIHPTTAIPSKSGLSNSEWDIYELVVRRYFATFAESAKWAHLRVDAEAAGHKLKANGKRLIEPGYHAVYTYYDTEETEVPHVSAGDDLRVADVRAPDKQTRPPNRYGQSQLIEQMEKLGLGTKSTRHNQIDKLYDRGYVTGNPPRPTELARGVITAAEEYASNLVSESMTSQLEADMTAIADGGTSLSEVTADSRQMLDDVFTELRGADDEINELIQDQIEDEDDDEDKDPVGECLECDGMLFTREAQGARFVGCEEYPDCEFTLPLPNKGRPHILDEVCDDHGLHHVKMIAGKKTFVFGCPKCEQEEAEETNDRVIGDCPDCGESHGGELAIKRVQSGSRLVGCTRFPDCDYSLPLPREGDIEITDEMCSDHELPELVVHKDDSSPWPLGCPICNYEEYKS